MSGLERDCLCSLETHFTEIVKSQQWPPPLGSSHSAPDSQPVNWMMASGQHNYYWNPQSSTWSPQPLSWDPPGSGNLAPVSSWQQSSLSWSPSSQEEPQEERRGGGRQGRGGRRQDKEKNRMAVRSSRAKKRREEEEIRMEIPVYREENRKLENSILGMEAKLELLGQIVSAQDQATGGQFSNSPEGSQIANIINGMEKGNLCNAQRIS